MAIFSHKGVHYHVSEWGDKENPPLVLLHGFSQSSATWDEIASELSRDYFVVAPDFVGHGQSDLPEDPTVYELGAALEMLTALLRWLWVDQVNLVGYSMGGRIALAYACTHPHHVASLTLESTGLGPKTEQQHQAMLKRDFEMIEKLMEGDLEKFMDVWENQPVFDSQKKLSPEVQAALRADRLDNDPRALALTVRGSGHHTMPDLSYKIRRLPLPVLYIAGVLDRKYVKVAEQLQHSPGISCVLMNTGHNTHLEAPQSFCRQVRAFLEERSFLSANNDRSH